MTDATSVTLTEGAVLTTLDGSIMLAVDGFRIDVDREIVRSNYPMYDPDPDWSVDHDGHPHTWSGDVVIHARREHEHIECDGSCGGVCEGEGYDRPMWVCSMDGTRLTPGYRLGSSTRSLVSAMTMSIDVSGGPLPREIRNAQIRERVDGAVRVTEVPRLLHIGDIALTEPQSTTYTGSLVL